MNRGNPPGVVNTIRRLADRGPLKRVLLQPRVRHVGATLMQARYLPAAWKLGQPWRFLWSEAKRSSVGRYRLRHTETVLVFDHRQGGLELIDEVFRQRCYDPPAGVAALIADEPVVLDLGANVGTFTAFASLRWTGARITAVEPDRESAALLREMCAQNSLDVDIIEACASVKQGELAFVSGQGAGSLVVADGRPMPAIDIYPLLEQADLVKIDIEGSEWPILLDRRLSQLDRLVLVMEYHNAGCPELPAVDAARGLLERAGFEVVDTQQNYWGHGLLWASKH